MRWMVWLGFLGGCGADLAEGECRGTKDCDAALVCQAPGTPQVCGIPPQDDCGACTADQYCAFDPEGCGRNYCHDACVDDGGCTADEVCDVATGRCEARSCSDGYTCAPDEVCDPGGGDEHDCGHPACDGDRDCSDGFCVNGACFAEPGQCVSNLPVP